MRAFAVFLILLPLPVTAWDFSPTPICTLTTPTEMGNVTVTFDPGSGEYAINLTLSEEQWDPAPIFSILFTGRRGLQISTDRHVISPNGKSLSVADTGFGNVLDGLEFNQTAQAQVGESTMAIPLAGAAEKVKAFRACGVAALS